MMRIQKRFIFGGEMCCVSKRYFSKSGGGKWSRSFATKKSLNNIKEYGLEPLAWYSRKLDSHPITTKSISSAVITVLGDLLSQYIEAKHKKKRFDWDALRTSRFGLMGLALVGPVIHFWYGAVFRLFPGTNVTAVAKRVMIDQFAFAPIFLPTFMSGIWILEGKNMSELLLNLQRELPTAIVANWSLWIPAQIINFRFVPLKYQVLFSNFVGFIWNTYLSFTLNYERKEENTEESK